MRPSTQTRPRGSFGPNRIFLLCAVIAWLLCGSAYAASLEGQKNVLLIYEWRSELLGNIVVDRTMRKALNDAFGLEVDIRSEYLEPTTAPKQDYPAFFAWLRHKYAARKFDVVVMIGSSALEFVRDYGHELFRGAQFVYWGRRAALGAWELPITGVIAPEMDSQLKGTFDFIRQLQPDLERLVVVSGTSPKDRSWESVARRELTPFENQIAITYLAGLHLEEVQRRLRKLSRKDAVLFLTITEDGTGRQLLRTQYLGRMVEESRAPVYSTSAIYLDTGIVGGALIDQEAMTVEAAGLVVRLLGGENIRNLPVRESSLGQMANWKALRRWGLREGNLPPGTAVLYREQSLWNTYKWHLIAVISLCLLEGGLIVALLLQQARRRRAEKAMMESKQLLQSAIDALSARVALLDQKGSIIATNRRWKSFEEASQDGASINAEETQLVSDGIRRLVAGELADFRCIYPFVKNNETSWFQVRVNRFDAWGVIRLVVTHEDVTEIKLAHDAQQQLTAFVMRAQDEERRRIARDLHDVTVQNMVAIKADLICVEREAKRLGPGIPETLRESQSLCDEVIHELRTLSYLLHPPYLDEAGLLPALQWFVRGFIQRSGMPVELLVLDDIPRLPKEVETTLFRVVQESLTNIHRHSGSRSALIWLTKEQENVVLKVVDEGHGFLVPTPEDGEASFLPGVGIQSMRQRLKQLGGEFEIESSPKGTTICAKISATEERNAAYFIG